MKKLIRYRLGVSRVFPATHPRKGEETGFKTKIESLICVECDGLTCGVCSLSRYDVKLHTIRANYPLWEKRMKKVQAGEAVIELYNWSGKPYNSKQVVFATLDKDSGCGVQELGWTIDNSGNNRPVLSENCEVINLSILAKNDGLSLEDFKAWFKDYNLSKPIAIIQFTEFRY